MLMLMNMQFNNSINLINMNKLNDKILMIMILLFMMITYMIKFLMKNKFIYKNQFNNQILEFIWTVIPMLIILVIANMSIITLYINNEMKLNSINIKIMGNQWFWNYNYINFFKNFNSYMLMKNKFNFNLIETDNKITIPMNYQIMIIVSSLDVIHSWTIPSMNIKIDAIPNQLNNMYMMSNKINTMFGQCSEICGINHSFMPIQMESINFKSFIKWIKK